MTTVPVGDARNRLSHCIAEVERTHQRVTITRHRQLAAVLIAADDFASIEETLEILGTPGALDAIREGRADDAARRFVDPEDVKARFAL